MKKGVGDSVRIFRELAGLTQEGLSVKSKVDRRTVQRIEQNEVVPEVTTLARIASALGISISVLRLGVTGSDLRSILDEELCPSCGARLQTRAMVPTEAGDEVDFEVFDCGHTQGWRWRPCPKDPAFPLLSDYEIVLDQEEGARSFICIALGKTEAARAVELHHGTGGSAEEALQWIAWSYLSARDGYEKSSIFHPIAGSAKAPIDGILMRILRR